MLLQTLEHLAYRLAGLSATIYAAEKTNILNSVIRAQDSGVELAAKTAAVLAVSEYLSDQALTRLVGHKPPAFTSSLHQGAYAFVTNTAVLFLMDKFDIDEMIVRPGSNDEMRAVQLAVLFIVVQEVTAKLFQLWGWNIY